MTLFNANHLSQGLVLAGSISLYSGLAQAQSSNPPVMDIPQGRAGTATLCIEKRSYVDVNTKTIVTPTIYLDKIPDEGINTGYVAGNAVATAWHDLLHPADPKKKEWMDQTDIPTQFQDGVDLVKKLDKNHDGIVSKEEFDAGERGASEDTKKIDLGLLMALACSGRYLTEGALNTVDAQSFPEVIALNRELAGAKAEAANQRQDLARTQKALATSRTQTKAALGFGLAAIGLAFGLGYLFSRKKYATPAKPKNVAPKANAPHEAPPEKIKLVKPGKATPPPLPTEAPKPSAKNYDDVIDQLNGGKAQGAVDETSPVLTEVEAPKDAVPANDPAAPSEYVLKALEAPAAHPAEAKAPDTPAPTT